MSAQLMNIAFAATEAASGSTKVAAKMISMGYFNDIAILYALMNFIGTIAVLKFFNYRALGVPINDGLFADEDVS